MSETQTKYRTLMNNREILLSELSDLYKRKEHIKSYFVSKLHSAKLEKEIQYYETRLQIINGIEKESWNG